MIPTRERAIPGLPLLVAAVLLTGCDVEWGGARMRLEEPALPARAADTAESAPDPVVELPDGPLLLAVRLDGDGQARVAPVARITVDGLAPLETPEAPSAEYRQRFAAAFQPPGRMLSLRAGGGAVGTLILGEGSAPGNESCPLVSTGQALLPPGAPAPDFAFAVTPGDSLRLPVADPPPATVRRNRVFAPILAERLLQETGVARPFLAARARIDAVRFPGDTIPGMASTYLIGDTLAPVPPTSGNAASLFFLARYDRTEGFIPIWSRIRAYSSPDAKEVLAYLGRMELDGSRTYFLRRLTADGQQVVAFREQEPSGELWWEEPEEGCPVLDVLEPGAVAPTPSPAPGAGGAPARATPNGEGGAGAPEGQEAPADTSRTRPRGDQAA